MYLFIIYEAIGNNNDIFIRGHTQTMWTAMGGGLVKCVHFTNEAYVVKMSTKGGQIYIIL